jgi:predicted Zn-dependent protease
VTEGGAGSLDSIAETEINGLEAVIASKGMRRLGMTANLASVAFRTSPSEFYGFSFATTARMTDAKIAEYRAIAESLSLLSPEELSEIRPYRVQVVTAGSLDTVESLAERSIYSDFAV